MVDRDHAMPERCTIEGLYTSFRGELKGFIAARTRDQALAEDLVQETFVRLAGYCGSGGSCTHPKALLFKVAANLVIDHFRQNPRRDRPSSVDPDMAQADPEDPPKADSDNLNREFLECFLPLIDQLPEPYRQAVRLADIEQVPQTEIAARLQVSVSGAKSRVQRGRAKLKELVSAICRIENDRYGNILDCRRRT
jgi:RNA polymerase sigma-70 factor (ECF subfamily)